MGTIIITICMTCNTDGAGLDESNGLYNAKALFYRNY